MAFAKQCDRCKSFYKTYGVKKDQNNPNGFMFLNIDEKMHYYSSKPFDLCPDCMEKLKTFLFEEGRSLERMMDNLVYYVEWFGEPEGEGSYAIGVFDTLENAIKAIEHIKKECEGLKSVRYADDSFSITRLRFGHIYSNTLDKVHILRERGM